MPRKRISLIKRKREEEKKEEKKEENLFQKEKEEKKPLNRRIVRRKTRKKKFLKKEKISFPEENEKEKEGEEVEDVLKKKKKKLTVENSEKNLLKIVSYNMGKTHGYSNMEGTLEILEEADADVGIIIEPSTSALNFEGSKENIFNTRNKLDKKWTPKKIIGNTQDKYVIVGNENVELLGTTFLDISTRKMGIFNVKKGGNELKIATGHAPFGTGSQNEAAEWLKKALAACEKNSIDILIGDMNTFSSNKKRNPKVIVKKKEIDTRTPSKRLQDLQSYKLAFSSPSTTAGSSLDKIYVKKGLEGKIENTGRIFFKDTVNKFAPAVDVKNLDIDTEIKNPAPQNPHFPIYLTWDFNKK